MHCDIRGKQAMVVRDLIGLRRAGGGAVRALADVFADAAVPRAAADGVADDVAVDATIVFADIERFSDLVARHGDDVAGEVLDALDRAVDAAVAGTGCRLVKRLGDGVMIAAEDPGDGVSCAVALPVRFEEAVAGQPHGLRLRVGAHRGVVRRRGDDLIGYHVNVAARVAEQATGGVTLLTGALRDSVDLSHRLRSREVGRLDAKGVPERPRLYQVAPVARHVA